MNHQPFEAWLLDDEPETPVDEQALKQHLAACPQCARLARGWLVSRQALTVAPYVSPSPGFTARFQARAAEKREAAQRRKAIFWIASTLAIGLIISLVLAFPTLNQLTFGEVIIRILTGAGNLIHRAFELQYLVGSLFQNVSPVLPVFVWVAVALTLTILTVFWVFAMWKIVVPKGVKA